MRKWSLGPGDPLVLSLAADFRFCTPDYVNDHIWELETGGGDPPALSLHTTYGLRARSMRFFPRFTINRQPISDPASFMFPPCLRHFFPNFLSLDFSPFPGLDVVAEYWVPDSHTVAGRFTVINSGGERVSLLLELCGQLVPINGKSLVPQVMQSVNVLVGRCADLAPVVFFTGGPQTGPGPYPSLALNMVLAPGDGRTLTWAQAALTTPKDSLELARKTIARHWEAERTRIELVNAAQTFDILTGDPDWDAALALSQKTAFSLFFGPSEHLPNPSFVFSRQADQGYSPRGDGSDYPYIWSGQSPLESYYIASLLPGAPELSAGLVRNFLAVQSESGAIDWKPGMAGQRGRWLAAPLLASLAWRTFQYTGDLEFLREAQPKLEAFTSCWFDISHDRDNDGFPEWDNPLQAGLEDDPSFTVWLPGGQGADISVSESPALAALLHQEARALARIAEVLDQPQVIERLALDSGRLCERVEECWDSKAVLYYLHDRDTHRSPTGKLLGSQNGSGRLALGKSFRQPVRLLVRIEFKSETTRRVEISLQGQNGDTPQTENFERMDFQWGVGVAVATTHQAYTGVTEIVADGLGKHDRVSVSVMDFCAEDVTLFLPLWAGIPDRDRALNIVHQTLMAAGRFGKPFGIPACVLSAHVSALACEAVLMPWNLLIGEGLLGYGLRDEAAQLTARLMSAVIQNLKQQHAFARAYHAVTGVGIGERNSIQGLAPFGLFLETLGVQIMSPGRVSLSGKNPFPWSVTVKYRGLTVTRQAAQTVVVFPDGRMITLDDPTNAVVSAD
jgi:hypothetical protein